MAIQQVASGSSNSIMSFLFQDDGAVEGTVLEGAEFARTLHQLLGEYDAHDAAAEDFMAMPATLAGETPLTTELDTLTTDFALPATSAALPDASNWESAVEGQEVEQPFWGIAPFTDVMAASQEPRTLPANGSVETQTDTAISNQTTAAALRVTAAPAADTAVTPTTVPADAHHSAKPDAPIAPVFAGGIQQVVELAHDTAQASAHVEQPFWGIAPFTDVMPALQEPTTLPAHGSVETQADTEVSQTTAAAPLVTAAPAADTAVMPTTVPADAHHDAKPDAPIAPVFASGIQHVIELARAAAQASTQLTTPSPLPTPMPRSTLSDTGIPAGTGRNAPAGGKFLPLNFRPAANTLNQAMAGLQARNAQATTTTETVAMPVSDTTFMMPELTGADARHQQAAPTPAPTQGIPALRADNALPNLVRTMAATETTANTPQFASQHLAGTDAWLQDLGTRVDWMKGLNVDKAALQLHPAELGLLEIQISAGDDGTTVSFVTHNAAARELIEDSMPRLRELLANQGMQLGQSQVSQHSEGQRRGQDLHQGPATQRDTTAADEPAPARRSAYLADPNRIDHYV